MGFWVPIISFLMPRKEREKRRTASQRESESEERKRERERARERLNERGERVRGFLYFAPFGIEQQRERKI